MSSVDIGFGLRATGVRKSECTEAHTFLAVVPGILTKMQNISSLILKLFFKRSLSQIILSSPGAIELKQHRAGALSHIRSTDPTEMLE